MNYPSITEGRFLSRPNRFIAQVEINGKAETVHVKNTGRCRELLLPGCRVFLASSDNSLRKTAYDLVAVEKKRSEAPPLLINMDSAAPNQSAEEWLRAGGVFPPGAIIRREVTHGNSRFDFYLEHGDRRAFLEVKGVTLEENGVARFPDAPTQRGVKHLLELAACLKEGYEAYVLFVIQMKGIHTFMPNDDTHPAFGEALRQAAQQGVTVLAMDCQITRESMIIDSPVPVVLQNPLNFCQG